MLTHRVRVLSLGQIARTWWAETKAPANNARARLAALEAHGLVELFYRAAHPELDLPEPLVTWTPGAPEPQLGALAYRLESRWPLQHRRTLLVVATRKAAAWFGGHGGRRPRATEVSHDLGVASLFLAFRSRASSRAAAWVSEASLAADGWGKGAPLPDAVLRGGGGEILIEFAGSYSKEKLEGFHEYCRVTGFSYEVW